MKTYEVYSETFSQIISAPNITYAIAVFELNGEVAIRAEDVAYNESKLQIT